MASERLTAIIDGAESSEELPISKLIDRIKHELSLGYYDNHMGQDMLKKVLKWATKYKAGDA